MKVLQLIEKEKKNNPLGVIGSPSSSFEAVADIRDINEESKLLGELVCFQVKEGDNAVLVLGQITEIETKNRWHEEPSFKGIIKRHGKLPNLSGTADNRTAVLNVQSSFLLGESSASPHKAANSPSTGVPVIRVNNEIMKRLMKGCESSAELVTIGSAYDTKVKAPFWFKHFGNSKEGGAGDSYHIGVFGRTGSGKTTTAANMILGYARNKDYMSVLILDPQEQFYEDNNVLPEGVKFQDEIKKTGMNFFKYKVPEDIALPNKPSLFSRLLLDYGFIRKIFRIHSQEKRELTAESIQEYILGRMNDPQFSVGNQNSDEFLKKIIQKFNEEDKYIKNVYASGQYLKILKNRIERIASDLNNGGIDPETKKIWNYICGLFKESGKERLETIIEKVILKPQNTVVLNISGRNAVSGMESVQTLFIKIIEDAVKEKGAELYAKGQQTNCLVVLDEAHRFINTYSFNDKIKELTTSIIDAVRTTRKYGIGYMFITQTIESLHEEIRRQIRIFAFGYGLTSGSEFAKIKDIINDDAGAKFYRSFIDPAANNKFPFMFYGPISPLSFTGAPLFLEMDGKLTDYSFDSSLKGSSIVSET